MLKENFNKNNFLDKEPAAQEKVDVSETSKSESSKIEELNNLKKQIQNRIDLLSAEIIKKGQNLLKQIFGNSNPTEIKRGEETLAPITQEIKQLSEETLEKVDLISAETKPELAHVDESADFDGPETLSSLEEKEQQLNKAELQAVARVAYNQIRQHANKLGIEIGDLSPEKISFLTEDSKAEAIYNTGSDSIKSKKKSVSDLIHEGLHFATATDNRAGSHLAGEKRLSKTGFHSYWDKKDINKPNTDILRSLNEAVTEKMAQEIFLSRGSQIEESTNRACWPIFMERKDVLNKQKQLELTDLEKSNKPSHENERESTDYNHDNFIEIEKKYDQKIPKNFGKEQKELFENNRAYPSEIRILNKILEKMAIVRSKKEGVPVYRVRVENKEWEELQKAYLKGNTLYLKNIEKAVGPGFLREFDDLDRRSIIDGLQTEEEFDNQVSALLKRLENTDLDDKI